MGSSPPEAFSLTGGAAKYTMGGKGQEGPLFL